MILDVSLPHYVYKYKAWSSQLLSFLIRKTAHAKDTKSILSILKNVSIISPMLGHFLNIKKHLETQASITAKNQYINKRKHENIKSAQRLFDQAFRDVSLNTIKFHASTKSI